MSQVLSNQIPVTFDEQVATKEYVDGVISGTSSITAAHLSAPGGHTYVGQDLRPTAAPTFSRVFVTNAPSSGTQVLRLWDQALIDHTQIGNRGTKTHAQIDAHVADTSLHYPVAQIDHAAILNRGANSHAALDLHVADSAIHFTQAAIDHVNLLNKGTQTHAQLDSHVGDGTIHFTQGAIDHTSILNKGTNTHAQVDSHIGDGTIHFTQGAIDHTSILNKGTNTHATIDGHLSSNSGHTYVGQDLRTSAAPTFAGINVNGLSTLTSTSANQLTLGYDGSSKVTFDVSSGGDLTIDASGNDLNLASTDKVHVLNATSSTSTSTGALLVSGGIGCLETISAVSSRIPRQTAVYQPSGNGTWKAAAVIPSGRAAVKLRISTNYNYWEWQPTYNNPTYNSLTLGYFELNLVIHKPVYLHTGGDYPIGDYSFTSWWSSNGAVGSGTANLYDKFKVRAYRKSSSVTDECLICIVSPYAAWVVEAFGETTGSLLSTMTSLGTGADPDCTLYDGGYSTAVLIWGSDTVKPNNLSIVGQQRVEGAYNSTSTSTGTLIVPNGGAAIGLDLWVGGGVYLPTSGGTASALAYYEETSLSTDITLILGVAPWSRLNITLGITRVGNVVTVKWPPIDGYWPVAGGDDLMNVTALSSRFRPSSTIAWIYNRNINGTTTNGAVWLTTDGIFTFYRSTNALADQFAPGDHHISNGLHFTYLLS